MRLAAVYINDGEYGVKSDIGMFGDYADAADAYRNNGSDYGRSETIQWLEVTEGLDERTLAANELTPNQATGFAQAKAASYHVSGVTEYGGFDITADNAGDNGNGISLTFDGILSLDDVVNAWNAANTSNTVTHNAVDGSIIVDSQTADLIGGYDVFSITADDQDAEGNLADLTFDGAKTLDVTVSDWNGINPTNTVSHNAPDGSIVVDAQTLDIEGGEGSGWELVVDATKQAEAIAADLVASKALLADTYVKDVYDELENRFGTRRDDTMNADIETWKLMSSDPTEFSSQGLLAVRATTSHAKGDALDTSTKIKSYGDENLADVTSYAVWRASRQKTYIEVVAAL